MNRRSFLARLKNATLGAMLGVRLNLAPLAEEFSLPFDEVEFVGFYWVLDNSSPSQHACISDFEETHPVPPEHAGRAWTIATISDFEEPA